MNCDPNWTNYLSALLTPVVAAFGIYIAFRQSQTAQNKLKFDLFDRRFSVYEAARNLIGSVETSRKARDEELSKFLVATREAKWLLNVELATYLDKKLYQKGLDLQALDSELEGLSPGVDRSANVGKQRKIKEHFHAQYDVLDQKLSSFLELNH